MGLAKSAIYWLLFLQKRAETVKETIAIFKKFVLTVKWNHIFFYNHCPCSVTIHLRIKRALIVLHMQARHKAHMDCSCRKLFLLLQSRPRCYKSFWLPVLLKVDTLKGMFVSVKVLWPWLQSERNYFTWSRSLFVQLNYYGSLKNVPQNSFISTCRWNVHLICINIHPWHRTWNVEQDEFL